MAPANVPTKLPRSKIRGNIDVLCTRGSKVRKKGSLVSVTWGILVIQRSKENLKFGFDI